MVCKAGRKGSHLYILKGITPDPKPQARIILPLTKVKELTRSENKKGKLLPCKSPESIFATASIILRFKKKKNNAAVNHCVFKWEFTTSYLLKFLLHACTSSKTSDLETRHATTMIHDTADKTADIIPVHCRGFCLHLYCIITSCHENLVEYFIQAVTHLQLLPKEQP